MILYQITSIDHAQTIEKKALIDLALICHDCCKMTRHEAIYSQYDTMV